MKTILSDSCDTEECFSERTKAFGKVQFDEITRDQGEEGESTICCRVHQSVSQQSAPHTSKPVGTAELRSEEEEEEDTYDHDETTH